MYIGLHVQYQLFLSDLIKLESSQQVFEKYSSIKFNENPSSGSRDRHDEANRRFSQFYEKQLKFSPCFKGIEIRLHYTGQPVNLYTVITSVYC